MSIHDDLLAAFVHGTLPEAISALPPQDSEAAADVVSSLHNSGKIDLLEACQSEKLDRIPQHSFFTFQKVFRESLPKLECQAIDAASACARVFDRAGDDLTAGLVFDALREWFRLDPSRAEDGLTLLRRNTGIQPGLVRSVLFAGASHDERKFTVEALQLSRHSQSRIRLDALFALGQITPKDDSPLVKQVLQRFDQCLDAPDSEDEIAGALEAALHLLHRIGDNLADDIQPLFLKACRHPTPTVRRVLADRLASRRKNHTDRMIDASFEALRRTDKQDIETVKSIDFLLYQWDLDTDRERVLEFVQSLLTLHDDAVEIDQLSNFRHKLTNGPGEILGWYVVSLLLTGDGRLCTAAHRLLPYQEDRAGLDIDIGLFALGPSWIPFLARKILGYCFLNREGTSALLLSCLRSVSDDERPVVEKLVFDHFLLNYLRAIEWFQTAVSQDDPAKESVKKLSVSLKQYVDELEALGTCRAFAPSQRERQLQRHHQGDFWLAVQKKAEEGSILSTVAHKATVLYGSGSIAYVHNQDRPSPQRKEIPFMSHQYSAEFPRLYAIDPVGLNYVSYHFKSERPPS